MRALAALIFIAASMLVSSASLYAQENDLEHDQDIVLVTSNSSDLQVLTAEPFGSLEIRKLFLGLPVTRNSVQVSGVVYEPNQDMNEIFLRTIVGMTRRTYDKAVLRARMSTGSGFLQSYDELQSLLNHLHSSPNTVSFLRRSEAKQNDLEVVQVLWRSRS